jgi:hypothetical protein
MHGNQIQKIIVIFSLINVLFVCLYGLLFFFIRQKNLQTTEIYSSLYEKESEKGALDSTEKSLADTEQQRKILDSYFINSTQAVSFIEKIEKLREYSHTEMVLNAVTPPKKQNEGLLLDFSASGNFEDIYRLFALIEKMPYRMTVRNAILAKSGNEKNPERWTGSFSVVLESYLNN